MIQSGADFDGDTLDHLDFTGVRARDVSFVDSTLDGCTFADTRLDGARVIDSVVRDCSGVGVQLASSVWREASIVGGRLGVLDLSDSDLTRVTITDCKIDFLNLRASRLRELTLRRVQVGELDCGGATGRRVLVDDCTVGVLDVQQARVDGLDVSTSVLVDEVRGLTGFRGLVLSAEQARDLGPALAAELGARVVGLPDR